jgi:hypothetical protein
LARGMRRFVLTFAAWTLAEPSPTGGMNVR